MGRLWCRLSGTVMHGKESPPWAGRWAAQFPGSRSQPQTMLSWPVLRPSASQTSLSAPSRCSESRSWPRLSRAAHSSSRHAHAAVRLSQRHLSASSSCFAFNSPGRNLHHDKYCYCYYCTYLLVGEARCICRQATGKGYPLMESCQTQARPNQS